jgi:heat shock protein HtpX
MGLLRTILLLGALSLVLLAAGYLVGGVPGVLVALIVAAGINVYSWWHSDKLVLRVQGAHPIDQTIHVPMLRRFVDDVNDLAARADLPPPRIYIIESPQPNAFATGRNPENAAIAATTGLLANLTREEVAGVMAHELAHIQNRDTLTMTVTATLAGAISTLGFMGLFLGGRGSERRNPLSGLLVMIAAPVAASIVQMAISRSREYDADRRGAEICGNPLWLASALEKIDRGVRASINQRAQRAPSMAHLYIANPLLGRPGDKWFSSHPAMSNRIAALRRMAAAQIEDVRAQPEQGRVTRGPWG